MTEKSDREAIVIVPLAYSPEAAARAVGRSRSRIYKALADKELTGRKDGRATVIETAELSRWISQLPTIGRPVAA
jgi:excisionase family DNA binding protein